MVNIEKARPPKPHEVPVHFPVFRKGDLKEKITAPMIWERSSYKMIYSQLKLNLTLRKIQAGESGFSITSSADAGHNPKI